MAELRLSDVHALLDLAWRENQAVAGMLRCATCRADRRCSARVLYGAFRPNSVAGITVAHLVLRPPALIRVECLQCSSKSLLLIHKEASEPELRIVAAAYGLATRHTPASVAYYLEQADRAEANGAMIAALPMYRAALDQIFFEHGYTDGMLGTRVAAFKRDREQGQGPAWGRNIRDDDLESVKKLADWAIHTNDGDVAKKAMADGELLWSVKVATADLLYEVYDREVERAERTAGLLASRRSVGADERHPK